MINIINISLVFQNGPPQLLSSNVTAIVDSGTGTIKGPNKAIQTIVNAFKVRVEVLMDISYEHASEHSQNHTPDHPTHSVPL